MSPSLRLIIVAVFAVAGWHHARHLTRKYGRRPFGWTDWVWGIVTGVSLLLGAVLLAVVERGLRKSLTPTPTQPAVLTYSGAMTVIPGQSGLGEHHGYGATGGVMASAPTTVAPAGTPTVVPPSWAPDPSGRHQYRWWDGTAWTASVHSAGVTSTDQL